MVLQGKIGTGIYTQVRQSFWGFLGPHGVGKSWDHAALGCTLFAVWLRKQEGLCLEEKV